MAMNESNITQNNTDIQAQTGFQKPLRLGIVYQEESGRGLTHPFFVLILDAFKQRAGTSPAFLTGCVRYEAPFSSRLKCNHIQQDILITIV